MGEVVAQLRQAALQADGVGLRVEEAGHGRVEPHEGALAAVAGGLDAVRLLGAASVLDHALQELHRGAEQIFNWAIEAGWDKEYGGLLYFIDCLGKSPEAYEHDMKLWWPHNEIMISSLMLYRDTRDEKYLEWFEKTVAYCKAHFSDPEYGEWYGYLRRDGKPTEPSTKGSTFKGPFHLPRALIQCDIMLGQLLEG